MRKVVGIHACAEVFKVRPQKIKKLYIKKDQRGDLNEFVELAKKNRILIQEVHPQELEKIASVHQGVALDVTETPEISWHSIEKAKKSFLVGLDGIEDPQNMGSILRTAWLLGVDGILSLKSRSVGLTPTVCKVASGGAEHVAIEEYNQLIEPIKELKQKGFWVYGLSEKAEKSLWDMEFPDKVLIIGGNENKGLKPQTINGCDEMVWVPQSDKSASYNVSISLTIAMAEISRQRHKNNA